jgi:hypothetical protein
MNQPLNRAPPASPMLVPIGHVVPHQLHGPCVVEVHRQQVPRVEELGPWQGLGDGDVSPSLEGLYPTLWKFESQSDPKVIYSY